MKRSDIQTSGTFFDRYIQLVPDEPILDQLEVSQKAIFSIELDRLEQLGDRVYATGKWTVKDILQHVIDNERVMAYRALRFSRNDKTVLPGYDETLFASEAGANGRSLSNILNKLERVRSSTIDLFSTFTGETMQRKGIAFNAEISVLALGFIIVGHQLHHYNVIRERYLPLI
jgi:hypothetical protein